jgi:hypothetical protein
LEKSCNFVSTSEHSTEIAIGVPSVYAHVVHVPCSPISPVIVALKALPPIDQIRTLPLPEIYCDLPTIWCTWLRLLDRRHKHAQVHLHEPMEHFPVRREDLAAGSRRSRIRIESLPGRSQLGEVTASSAFCYNVLKVSHAVYLVNVQEGRVHLCKERGEESMHDL